MVLTARPFWLAGAPAHGGEILEVRSPYDGRVAASVSVPTDEQVEQAVAAATDAARSLAHVPAHVRAAALTSVAEALLARTEEVAQTITAETGKPLQWSRAEVRRASSTFRWSAEEARRWSGEVQRLDTEPGSEGRTALVARVPRGPVLAITPFNFPLNLAAHKVGPAVAVGCPVVLKPAPAAPLTALLLGELLAATDLPAAALSVLPVSNAVAERLVADPRLPVVSFTGSGPVGAAIQAAAPHKHVTLELGGNAAAVVCRDWSDDADLALAARRVAAFGTYQAGQSCISVQRVIVDRTLHDRFVDLLVDEVRALRTGDPANPETHVGPLIDVAAASRVQQWVDEAVSAGGRVRAGGTRDGATYAPTVLTDVPRSCRVVAEEVFGPVVVVEPVDDLDAALAAVNASRYGLQAGVFTHDLRTAFRAFRELAVGGVVIGDVPSFRAEQMPYGGVKESGSGREGVRWAMEDLTTTRVLVLTGC